MSDPSDPLDNLVGYSLVGFHLTALLGSGGMAAVFRGENTLDPSIVRALKIVRPELAARPEFVKRFTEEARFLEKLTHPNVVRFFGVRREHEYLVIPRPFPVHWLTSSGRLRRWLAPPPTRGRSVSASATRTATTWRIRTGSVACVEDGRRFDDSTV